MKDFAYDTRNQLVNEIFELEEAQENVKFNSPSSNIIKKSVPRVFNYKNIMEVFTQIEIHEYLYQLFTASNNLYKDDLDGILRYLLEIAYIHFFHEALVKNRVQKVCIQIQTLNENTGIDERNYLYKLYNEMLEKMKLPRDAFLKENELQSNDYLFSEGPGLYDLFKGEQGAHIFFNPLKNTQLILVFIHNVPESLTCSDFIKNLIKQRDLMYGKLNKGEISSKELMRNFVKIIRLYSIQPDLKIRKNTVTDIRTGTVYREEMLRESFKLLLYEGLDDKYKASLGE
jgi:hypothetical protein